MIVAGIIYFAIPEITKEVAEVSGSNLTVTGKITLAAGPIIGGIFSLIGGLAVTFNGVKGFIIKK